MKKRHIYRDSLLGKDSCWEFRSLGSRDDEPAAEATAARGQHSTGAQAAFVFQSSQMTPLGGLGKVPRCL